MAAQPLPPQARRLRVLMISAPIMCATGFVLYQRLVEGKPRRTLPKPETMTPEVARRPLIEVRSDGR